MPKRILEGLVVSDKGDKTVVVNAFKEGDVARIRECAPKSKLKRWEVLSKDTPASAS
jgi:small subunit ribosomal protein S17